MDLKKIRIFFSATCFLLVAIFSLRADPQDLLDTNYTLVAGLTQCEIDNIINSAISGNQTGVLSQEDLCALYQDINLSNQPISDYETLEIYPDEPIFFPTTQIDIPKKITRKTTSCCDGIQQRKAFMDQARKELDNKNWLRHQQPQKISIYNLLHRYELSAINYIGIAEICPEMTFCELKKLSKLKVTKIKKSMEELKRAFNSEMDFRKEAKGSRQIGHFKTKSRWFNDSYYAIEKLADHVIGCAQSVIHEKYLKELDFHHKIKKQLTETSFSKIFSRFYEFARGTILGESAVLASSRVISFASSFIKNILDNPFATGKNIIFSVGHQIAEVFELFGWEDKINNPETYFCNLTRQQALLRVAQEMCTTTRGLMGKANSFIYLMETSPRQATIEFFATAMEFVLLDILLKSGTANYGASKFVKPAVDSMRTGLLKIPHTITLVDALEKIRRGCGSDVGVQVADTSMIIAYSELGEISKFLMESVEKEGARRGAIRRTMEIIEKHPDLIVVGKKPMTDVFKELVHLSPSKRKAYIAKSELATHFGVEKTLNFVELINKNKPWAVDRFKHVVLGDLSATRGYKIYGGLHTWEGFERFLKLSGMDISEFVIEDLGKGVFGVHFPENAFVHPKYRKNAIANMANGESIKGIKTFWPRHYTHSDMIKAGNELFANSANATSIRKGSTTFKKQLNSGLKIQGTMKPSGEIGSVYPSWIQ